MYACARRWDPCGSRFRCVSKKASTRGCAAKASEAASLPAPWSGRSSTAGLTSRTRRGRRPPGSRVRNLSGSRDCSEREKSIEARAYKTTVISRQSWPCGTCKPLQRLVPTDSALETSRSAVRVRSSALLFHLVLQGVLQNASPERPTPRPSTPFGGTGPRAALAPAARFPPVERRERAEQQQRPPEASRPETLSEEVASQGGGGEGSSSVTRLATAAGVVLVPERKRPYASAVGTAPMNRSSARP